MHEVSTMSTSDFATSGSDNVAVIPANKERTSIVIGNTTGAIITLAFRRSPTATNGIPLLNGETIRFAEWWDGTGIHEEIRILTGGAGVVVPYTQFLCSCINRRF